jgi:hypothetical protein
MWLKEIFSRLTGAPALQQSEFERVRDALKPSGVRAAPPKPSTQPPQIAKRAK